MLTGFINVSAIILLNNVGPLNCFLSELKRFMRFVPAYYGNLCSLSEIPINSLTPKIKL